MQTKQISAIIITKNEENNIEKCITSLINSLNGLDYEILLIDSTSTDRTIDKAKKYPIKIFQTYSNKQMSPSAGRYLGTKYASGKYLFFVDADVIVMKNFIKKALKILKNDVAGVRGILYIVKPNEQINKRYKERTLFGDISPLWGQAAIYRKDVLKKSGTFNPFLKGEEERELAERIRFLNYKLLTINIPMGYHMNKTLSEEEITEKASYFRGVGQILITNKCNKKSINMLKSYRSIILEEIIFIGIIILLLTLIVTNIKWGICLTIALVGIAVSIKGFKKTLLRIRSRIFILINLLKGLHMGLQKAENFDKIVKVRKIK